MLTVGRWNHILATYDGSGTAAGVTLYVDGRLQELAITKDSLQGKHAHQRASGIWPHVSGRGISLAPVRLSGFPVLPAGNSRAREAARLPIAGLCGGKSGKKTDVGLVRKMNFIRLASFLPLRRRDWNATQKLKRPDRAFE